MVLLAACVFAAGSTVFLLSARRQAQGPLHYQCYETAHGWGYDILAGNKIIMHQPFIPSVPGHAGFKQQHDAAAVARFVIEKIKSGEMPAINQWELQRLGVYNTQDK
jgi:hypothetical protein